MKTHKDRAKDAAEDLIQIVGEEHRMIIQVSANLIFGYGAKAEAEQRASCKAGDKA